MNVSDKSPLRLHKMHTQKLLTLRWGSFSECGRACIVNFFAKEACQYIGYE